MESPPSFTPPGKKSNTGLIVGLIIGGVVLCCVLPIGLIAGGGIYGFNKLKGTVTCAIGFRDIRDAVLDYSNDNNGKLPTASKWMDQVRPYYKKRSEASKKDNPFGSIPVEGVWSCTNDGGVQTGIAFNTELSDKYLKNIQDRASKIVVFEVPSPALNKNEVYTERPKSTSPKMFGEPRGWITGPLEGKMGGSEMATATEDGGSRREVKVKVN